jgi:hypothetical protein
MIRRSAITLRHPYGKHEGGREGVEEDATQVLLARDWRITDRQMGFRSVVPGLVATAGVAIVRRDPGAPFLHDEGGRP